MAIATPDARLEDEIIKNAIKTLISYAPNEDAADEVISEFSKQPLYNDTDMLLQDEGTQVAVFSAKTTFLTSIYADEIHKFRHVETCDPPNASALAIAKANYWGLLAAILDSRWR